MRKYWIGPCFVNEFVDILEQRADAFTIQPLVPSSGWQTFHIPSNSGLIARQIRSIGAGQLMNTSRKPGQRHAAIAVIVRDTKLLVIERSAIVRAPSKFCFPGGEVEKGEHVAEAVVREMQEEMGLIVRPIRQIWTSIAPSTCVLNWIHCRIDDTTEPSPSTREVASWQWMTCQELAEHPEALSTNLEFLKACDSGEVRLPTH